MPNQITKIKFIIPILFLLSGLFFAQSINTFAQSLGATTTVARVNQGGTGTSTRPKLGQLFIGNQNGLYSLNTLTAGSNITITNATNSITIVASGVSADWVKELNFGVLNLTASTTIPYWAKDAIYASSTITSSGTATSSFAGVLSVGSTTPGATALFSVGTATPKFTVDRITGNIGIGAANPVGNLQLAGNSPKFTLTDNTAGSNLKHWFLQSTGGTFRIATTSDGLVDSALSPFFISSDGEIGIWEETPLATMHFGTTRSITDDPGRTLMLDDILVNPNVGGGREGIYIQPNVTNSGAGTLSTLRGISLIDPTFDGSATNVVGIAIENMTGGGSNNINILSGGLGGAIVGNYSIYGQSSRQSYLGGNLGIGSTTPWAALAVTQSLTDPVFIAEDGANDPTPFIIDTNGNVGIQTLTAGSALTVVGNQTLTGDLDIYGGDINLGTGAATSTLSSASGLLGIGSTTPWGDFSVEMDTTNPSFVVSNQGSSTPALFVGGVNQNGYIGIGTAVPNRELTVIGGITSLLDGSSTFPLLGSQVNTIADRTGTILSRMVIQGKFLYTASDNGLNIFDISTNTPALISTEGTSPLGVLDISGRFVYGFRDNQSAGFNRMVIYDVSNPFVPLVLSNTILPNIASFTALFPIVSGNFLYLPNTSFGTSEIWDISNPARPFRTGVTSVYAGGGSIGGVAFYGKYLYVTNRRPSITDVSDPYRPVITCDGCLLPTGGTGLSAMTASGNYIYVLGSGSGNPMLRIFDVTNPSGPRQISTLTGITSNVYESPIIHGRYLYFTDTTNEAIVVADIVDPVLPVQVARFASGGTDPVALAITGDRLFVQHSGGSDLITVFRIPSAVETSAIKVGALEAGSINTTEDILTRGSIKVFGGMNVGTQGISTAGAFTSLATTSANFFLDSVYIGTSSPATNSPNFFAFKQSTAVIEATSSASIPLTLRGAGTQIGDYFRIQDSANNNLLTVTSSGGLIASASSTFSNTLNITGAIEASSTLRVSGLASLAGGLISNASSTITQGFNVTGPIEASSTLRVGRTISVLGTSGTSTIASGQGFTIGGSQLVLQQTSGRVGIGTSVPGAILQVEDGTEYLRVIPNDPLNFVRLATPVSHIEIESGGRTEFEILAAPDYYQFRTGDIELVRILGDGRMGIGTSTPARSFSVQGNSLISGDLTLANLTATGTVSLATTTITVNSASTSVAVSSHNLILANDRSATDSPSRLLFQARDDLNSATTTGLISGILTQNYFAGNSNLTFSLLNAGALTEVGRFLANGILTLPSGFISSASSTIASKLLVSKTINASSSLAVDGGVYFGGSLGVGTTSPSEFFSVQGNSLLAGTTTVGHLIATSSITVDGSATSTFSNNGINIKAGCFAINGTCAGGITGNGTNNEVTFWNGANSITSESNLLWDATDNLLVTRDTLSADTVVPFRVSNLSSGGSNGAPGVGIDFNLLTTESNFGRIAVTRALSGTTGEMRFFTTDSGTLTERGMIDADGDLALWKSLTTATSPEFYGASIAFGGSSTSTLSVASGNLGVGTTTPGAFFSVHGNTLFVGTSTVRHLVATSTIFAPNLTAGAAGDNDVCIDGAGRLTNAGASGCIVSSIRFKRDIMPLVDGLKTVLSLKPIIYINKDDSKNVRQPGFIAEEAEKVDKKLIGYEQDGKTPRSFRYEQYTAYLTSAIQESYNQFQKLAAKVIGLEKKLLKLENKLYEQQKTIDRLEIRLNKLENGK